MFGKKKKDRGAHFVKTSFSHSWVRLRSLATLIGQQSIIIRDSLQPISIFIDGSSTSVLNSSFYRTIGFGL